MKLNKEKSFTFLKSIFKIDLAAPPKHLEVPFKRYSYGISTSTVGINLKFFLVDVKFGYFSFRISKNLKIHLSTIALSRNPFSNAVLSSALNLPYLSPLNGRYSSYRTNRKKTPANKSKVRSACPETGKIIFISSHMLTSGFISLI